MEEATSEPRQAREGELELSPRPQIKKLSSAIVWIAAIFAVAVLWLVGYLVTSKAKRPTADRGAASSQPQVDDLAERIQRAAEREAKLSAERASSDASQPPSAAPTLPPGFEELLNKRPRGLGPTSNAGVLPGFDPEAQPPSEALRSDAPALATSTQTSPLARARDSELVPAAFRSVAPRTQDGLDHGGPASAGVGRPPAPPDFAALGTELLRSIGGKKESDPAPSPTPARSPEVAGSMHAQGSPFRISAGSLIPAVLTTGINSDLPGQATALVRRDVYDSRTGRYLLIPQGSRLVGEYDSRVAFGQRRVLVAWNRLIFPDGRSLDLAGMPGADLAAMAGLHDKVNSHFARAFGSALLLAAVSAGGQLSQPSNDRSFGSSPTPSQIAAAAVGQELGRVSSEYLRRNLDVRPTIEVRPGYELNVEVTADLDLDGAYPDLNASTF